MSDWIGILMLQVTVVALIALLAASWPLKRNAAARHAVMLCALMIIATGPIWILAAQFVHWPAPAVGAVRQLVADDFQQPLVVVASTIAIAAAPSHRAIPIASILLTTWAAGTAFLLLRFVIGMVKCAGLSRQSIAHPAGFRISDRVAGPVCVGIFRPTILLPAGLVDQLTSNQLRQVVDHEFAHVRRRDHLVVLLQRLVGAMWWVHPLVYLLNRELDRAREESCDNEVISQGHDRVEYARTLLHIADWISNRGVAGIGTAGGTALGLLRWNLERRVKELVDERRNLMTRAPFGVVLTAAAVLAAGAIAISGRGQIARADVPTTTAPAQLSIPLRAIPFEMGAAEFEAGDGVTIEQVFCTGETLTTGEIFIVRGTYTLASRDAADLALFITARAPQGSPIAPQQRIRVAKGTGKFELRTSFVTGNPHVSFYPAGGGSDFGGVYFGQGESLLKSKEWSHKSGSKATDSTGERRKVEDVEKVLQKLKAVLNELPDEGSPRGGK